MIRRLTAALLKVVVALLIGFNLSCESKSPTAPSDSTLVLSTTARSVSSNGTAVFTADLRNSTGAPTVGASITFSTTVGTIDPQAVTNGAGQATAVFSAGTASGTAIIKASSGSVTANPISLILGTAAVGRVAVTSSPASIPFGGGSTVVTAVITDPTSNPLVSMPVTFSTTAGNVTPANAKTDGNGMVQTTLTTAAGAVVTAAVGASPSGASGIPSAALTGSITVPLSPRPTPVVSIVASANPVANSPTTFTIGATPAPGTTTTIRSVTVLFGDGDKADLGAASGAAITAQHVYAVGGTYTVTMTAIDSAGATATASTVIAVKAAAPLAVSIVAGPMVPAGGGPNAIVTFTATVLPATAVINSYLWDFGDGGPPQPTTANQIQHVYTRAGLYTVTLTATEALTGLTAIGTVPVSTSSAMPLVSLVAPLNPVAGRPIAFTIGAVIAAASNAAVQDVRITFGDGTAPVDLGAVSGSAIAAAHVYAAAGTYLVSVTVTDNSGGTATASAPVVVAAAGTPSVSVTASANPVAGASVTFSISATPSSGNSMQNVQITFGDGSAPVDLGAVGPTATTQHVYLAGGTYSVTVTATDSGGGMGTTSTQVVVAAPLVPSVSVTAGASSIAGSPTSFTITAAAAAGTNGSIQNVRVTFGDGSAPVDLGAINGTATTQHVYAASGSYTISATATDGANRTATASTQVVVGAPLAPSVSVTAGASSIAGSPTSFTITAAAAAGTNSSIQNVRVTFGDGSAPVDLGAINGTATTQHVYAASGSYTVSATATDGASRTATASTQVTVTAPGAPSVSLTASASPLAGTPTTFTVSAAPAAGRSVTIQNVRVDFGDGTTPVDLGAVTSPIATQHVYLTSGTYAVSATATDTGNATATVSLQLIVGQRPTPTVSITASANSVIGQAVTFTISATPAPGGTNSIQNVQVDFGDGGATSVGAVSGMTTTQHVYGASGTFTVVAIATDSSGSTARANTTVVVVPAATVLLVAGANVQATVGTQFTATVLAAPGVVLQSVILRFGDGTQSNLGQVGGAPVVISHTYSAIGTFLASLDVTFVGGPPPTSATASVTVGCPQLTHTFSINSTVVNALHAWPGGNQTFAAVAGCSVTISAPTGTISNLINTDTWTKVSASGYSVANCSISPQVPSCGGVGSSSGLLGNQRPYCSNAAATIFDHTSTATLIVSCH